MKVLVTGGSGFIGSHIVDFHLNRGDEVCVIDNLFSGKKENIETFLSHPKFQFIEADICQYEGLKDIVSWSDTIYHMAAVVGMKLVLTHPVESLNFNIRTCERILEEVAKTNKNIKVLIASSSCVYNSQDIAKEEDSLLSLPANQYIQNTYPVSKIVAESMAVAYGTARGVHCVIARPFNIIGTHQTGRYGMVVPTFVRQALRNQPLTVYGDGSQSRSFCDVRNAVESMHKMLETPTCKGEIINVGYPKDITILELAELIKKKTNSSSKITFTPYEEAYGMEFHDVLRRLPVIDKLTRLTGFIPKYTLDDALDQIIALEKKDMLNSA